MGNGFISQEEIDALLNGGGDEQTESSVDTTAASKNLPEL